MRAIYRRSLLCLTLGAALALPPALSSEPAKALVFRFPNVSGLGILETVVSSNADLVGLDRMYSNKRKLANAIGTVKLPADQCRFVFFRPGLALIRNPQLIDAISPENITALRFSFTSTCDSEDALADGLVARISHLKNLRSINFSNCDLSDVGAKGLHDLPQLKLLDLGRTMITAKTVPVLSKLMGLEQLVLECADLASADLGQLARLPKLFFLGLHGAQIKDAQLVALKQAKLLTVLDLSNNPGISNASLPSLAAIPHLQYLNLSDTAISLRALRKLAHIKRIVVSERDLKGVSLQEMRKVVANLDLDAQVVQSSKIIKPGKEELHLFAPTRF